MLPPHLPQYRQRHILAPRNLAQARQVAPAMARVNAILDDVKAVSTRVKEETERVDQAIHSTAC